MSDRLEITYAHTAPCHSILRNRRGRLILSSITALAVLLCTVSHAAADTVTAAWDRNPEPDIAGYRLSYGTSSGSYTTTIDVGNVTTRQVTLSPGQRYFFVVQAYNTSGLASPRSAEVSVDLTSPPPPPPAPTIASVLPASGGPGTAVTIDGANFGATAGSSTVRFNGTAATTISWSATRIVATVPGGATSGPVTVTVGGVTSNGVGFTVVGATTVITLQQRRSVDAGTTASASLAFPAANGAGNFIAVLVRYSGTRPSVTVTDTRGNTYRRAVKFHNGRDHTVAIYYAENVGGGANTVTVALTAARILRFAILEYAGVARTGSLDKIAGARQSGTAPNSGTVTTQTNGELLLGVVTSPDGVTMTPGAGYTARETVAAAPATKLLVEDRIQATAGAAAATATLSVAQRWAAGLATFRPAPSATSQPSVSTLLAPDGAEPTGTEPANASAMAGTAGDFDGDGRADAAVYRPSTRQWWIRGASSSTVSTAGDAGSVPAPGDYDGDGRTDPASFTPLTGAWDILLSSGHPETRRTISLGGTSDIPVPGDYDGDGITDVAVYQRASGQWTILTSSTGFAADMVTLWGAEGDVPVPGYYDEDARMDLAVYRPATAQWLILQSTTAFSTSLTVAAGGTGDLPASADYDGDGRTDVAVYRPSSGVWTIVTSGSGFASRAGVAWGSVGEQPVPGDFDGDERADLALFRSGHWRIRLSSDPDADGVSFDWGQAGDLPLQQVR